MKLIRNEKGFKFNDLKPFLFFLPSSGKIPNQLVLIFNKLYLPGIMI